MNMDGTWDNMNLPQNEEQSNLDKVNIEEDNGVKTFRVKNYIPKRSVSKYLEPPYSIGIAIISILIIIIIILASLKHERIVSRCSTPGSTEETNQEVIFDPSTELILVEKNRFYIYDPLKATSRLLLEVKKPVQYFDIGVNNSLFWLEANSSNISSDRYGNGSATNVNLIFDEERVKPFAVAMDSINNNLFIVDESMPGLIVINLETKYYALMLTIEWIILKTPRYIALDDEEGIMFIASTTMIKRANVDGSNFRSMVSNRAISGIALDPMLDTIFWIHNNEVIQSCDYFGMNHDELLIDTVPILDLTIVDGYLFWLRKSSQDDKATQLWRCKVENGTCGDHVQLPNVANYTTLIKVAGRISEPERHVAPSTRQKCEHITLSVRNGLTTCVCNMSSQIVFNKKCEPVSQFILYSMAGVTRSRTLDLAQKIVTEPFWPTPYRVTKLTLKKEIDFEYDFENDDFYFSDDMAIYRMKLRVKNPQQEIVLVSEDSSLFIEDLAYDWLTGNMYFSRRSMKTSGKHSLAVFNVRKGFQITKTLKYFDYDSNFGLEAAAYGLAVYPSRGLLFFTAGENGSRYIYQTTSNGTVISKFTNVRYVHEYRLIGLDYERDRLYWISSENSVTHANFDGTNRRDIATHYLYGVKTLSVSRQWMYLSSLGSVWRVNKDTGLDFTAVSPMSLESRNVSGARIISQPQVAANPCRNRNGGCAQLCFYGAKATCDCADGYKVMPDGSCKQS